MNAVLLESEPVAIEADAPAQAIAAAPARRPASPQRQQSAGGLVLGELMGLLDDGCTALVIVVGEGGKTNALRARSLAELSRVDLGRRVALMFENDDRLTPIVIGVMREGSAPLSEGATERVELSADGAVLTVTAREQLVLRCGAASITLTKAGKVVIKGAYVVSHATGANRIRGGTVQIN